MKNLKTYKLFLESLVNKDESDDILQDIQKLIDFEKKINQKFEDMLLDLEGLFLEINIGDDVLTIEGLMEKSTIEEKLKFFEIINDPIKTIQFCIFKKLKDLKKFIIENKIDFIGMWDDIYYLIQENYNNDMNFFDEKICLWYIKTFPQNTQTLFEIIEEWEGSTDKITQKIKDAAKSALDASDLGLFYKEK